MKKKRLSIALASLFALGGTLTHSSLDVFAYPIHSSAYSIMENPTPDARQLAGFKDVSNTNIYYDEIKFLSLKQIIQGLPDGFFKPDHPITRSQVAIMIGRALELDGEPRNTEFSDVSAKISGSGYIASVVEKGIMEGDRDKTFHPYQRVSREQIAIFLTRAFQLTGYDYVANTLTDINYDNKGFSAILKVHGYRIVDGYPDGTFRPYETVSRGQFAAYLARALEPSFRVASIFAVDSIIDEKNGTLNIDIVSNNAWVIKFNNKLDWISLRDHIYVVRESDKTQYTPNIYYSQKSSTVKMDLGELYNPNETYYLHITKDVKSISGQSLAQPIMLKLLPSKSKINVEKSVVHKGVQFDTELEQSDGKMFIHVTATNISGESIPYVGYNGCDRGMSAVLYSDIGNGPVTVSQLDPARTRSITDFPVCTQNIPQYILKPGASAKITNAFYPTTQQLNGKNYINILIKTGISTVVNIPLEKHGDGSHVSF
jgi:hypothetical protein